MLKLIVATGEDVICCTQEQEGAWRASRLTSGRGVQCLAVDPRRPGVLYGGSCGEGAWRTDSIGNA